MPRYHLVLPLGLALFLVGCGEKTPPPAGFPTTPDAPGTGKVDSLNPAAVDNPPADPESPKNLAVPDVEEPKPEETAPAKDVEGKPDSASVLDSEELDEIRKLSAEQQTLAITQVNCPISGEHLGSMGKPVARTVEGTSLFLCCKGCIEELEKDPKAAIAKLPKK